MKKQPPAQHAAHDALATVLAELANPAPDTARIKRLMPHVKPGTLPGAAFDQIVAIYAVDMIATHPETLTSK